MSEPTPPGPPQPLGPPPDWRPPPLSAPQPTRTRTKQVVVVGLVVLVAGWVLAAAVFLPRLVDELKDDNVSSPEIGEPTLDGVQTYPGLSTEHRDDVDIDYEQVPPVGGPHDPEWLRCGGFDEPLRDENAVHDLEHGTVWITYDPDLDAEDVALLADLLPDDGIMSPYEDLPAPVVVTVWGAQLHLTGADDPRLPLFLEEYGDGSTAPEPLASCEGGLTDPRGGSGADA